TGHYTTRRPVCRRCATSLWRAGNGSGSLEAGSVRPDIDLPAGEPGGEAGILPFLADRQRELVVRYDHPRRLGGLIDDLHAGYPRRGERIGHERGRVLAVIDDVDLLPVQFGHHRA